MKLIATFIAAGLLFTVAAQDSSQDTQKSETKKVKAKPAPPPPTIPSDATPLPDGSFRHVDKNGKKWIYRNTPFGVSKSEEHPAAAVVDQITDDPAKSEDLGESVRFTRPTPFGPKVWTKKKTELDTYEKGIWERDRQRSADKNPERESGRDRPREATKQD
jgi:hypothetical protein